MSITGMLYKLIIGPLVLLFDVVYALANRYLSPGLSLIVLSLAINFLVLPLYNRADAMQEEEREQGLRMKRGVDHIKASFKGDERFMILQTYYRQNGYKPYYVLKGSLSLLLEIPFFIAAYRYLSGLQLLQGVSFGPIPDLGKPDGLIRIAGYTLNALPILMTAINIVSGAVYTRGQPMKNKLQLYGMALVFLVLLFDSPAGLVFYWTLNNVFSLGKNIFKKLRDPKRALCWLSSGCGVCVWGLLLVHPPAGMRTKAIAAMIGLGMQLPLIIRSIRQKHPTKKTWTETKTDKAIFFSSCLFLTVLTGLLIPSAVIKSSPEEFVNIRDMSSPLQYLWSSGLLAAGTFLLWSGIFYKISSSSTKKGMSLAFALGAGMGVTDYMFFGKNYGNMTSKIQYESASLKIYNSQYLKNILVLLGLMLLLWLVWEKKKTLLQSVCAACCIAVLGMFAANAVAVHRDYEALQAKAAGETETVPCIRLDKIGKNVMVIMMDRSITEYIPFIMEERPELREKFDGFTYYPNTCSFGRYTNVGAPPVFGGYEYTPEEMNKRPDLLLKDKHNEALKLMPLLFLGEGYSVTVSDPPYANYGWIPDLSIFNEYPEICKFNTIGSFTEGMEDSKVFTEHVRDRNLFCYGIFRCAPLLFHIDLYCGGSYNEADYYHMKGRGVQDVINNSEAFGIFDNFMDGYNALKNLSSITEVTDSGKNTFLMLYNDTPHDIMMLQEPAFEPAQQVDNSEYDREHRIRYDENGEKLILKTANQNSQYQCMMAAMIQLGNWMDTLRANGVYDNTRIIIVSDHGRNMGRPGRQLSPDSENRKMYEDVMCYEALLLVKDFDAEGFFADTVFMTNADTPLLAMKGLIEDPVNPFTGNPITDDIKHRPELHLLFCNYKIAENNGYIFDKKSSIWLTLRNGNVFDLANWEITARGTDSPNP